MESLEQFSGGRLRIARIFQGHTQVDLAEKLGVTQQFVAQLERGRKEPNRMLVAALADVLGFEPAFFYGTPLTEFTDAECNFRRRRTSCCGFIQSGPCGKSEIGSLDAAPPRGNHVKQL